MKKLIAMFIVLLPASAPQAAPAEVAGLRMWPAPDNTRVVLDVSAPVEYTLFRLSNPDRLVVDLKDTRLAQPPAAPLSDDKLLKNIRIAPRNGTDMRMVLDLQQRVRYKCILLRPNQEYGHRLVIDLFPEGAAQRAVVKDAAPAPQELRDVVVAIDAGHGGEDPGARGYSGVFEKDVVLEIARRLEGLIAKERGMRPVMIRSGDYFISLRDRTLKARQEKADLLVSIHADAFQDKRVNGMSLYVLSYNGASDEAARWLAEKENSSDLIGGVSLDDKDNLLASVLLDLSQSATIESSYEAGEEFLKYMGRVARLHKERVQQAGFAVLKSPDVPSLLIETAFISNPEDERNLKSSRFQEQMAHSMLQGIRGYFARNPPAGTLYAARRHVIARGETLSGVAAQYRVSVDRLRDMNELRGDMLRVGEVLRIPSGSEG